MPWITFTSAHVREGLAAREIAIYEDTIGTDFEGNATEVSGVRIEAIAARVCEQFRGIILGNPMVTEIGPAGTIPAFCLPWAIAIARVSMLGLSPVDEGKTDPRRDEYNDAIKGRDSLKSMNVAAFAIADPITSSPATLSASYGGSPLLEF